MHTLYSASQLYQLLRKLTAFLNTSSAPPKDHERLELCSVMYLILSGHHNAIFWRARLVKFL